MRQFMSSLRFDLENALALNVIDQLPVPATVVRPRAALYRSQFCLESVLFYFMAVELLNVFL